MRAGLVGVQVRGPLLHASGPECAHGGFFDDQQMGPPGSSCFMGLFLCALPSCWFYISCVFVSVAANGRMLDILCEGRPLKTAHGALRQTAPPQRSRILTDRLAGIRRLCDHNIQHLHTVTLTHMGCDFNGWPI